MKQRKINEFSELTWHQAIQQVLKQAPSPLHVREITEQIMATALRKNLGATPAATVNAQISSSIKHDENSPYIRVGRGIFALRQEIVQEMAGPKGAAELFETAEREEQNAIIAAFGMFWKRDMVEWKVSPQLLGLQPGATVVDFSNQLGVYLLYDGREVIYVGRASDRPLGIRLYEHTKDRLSTRWDRFSWFGLLPVSESGELGSFPNQYEGSQCIPALEAILIESLEPRQNRKKGDNLVDVEYHQTEDSHIKKKKRKELLQQLLSEVS